MADEGRYGLSVVCIHSTTPGKTWGHHGDLRPAMPDTNGPHRYLCFGGETGPSTWTLTRISGFAGLRPL